MLCLKKIKKKLRPYYLDLFNKIDYSLIDINIIDIDYVNQICTEEAENKKDLLNYILSFKSELTGLDQSEERAFPGDSIYLSSGHYKHMLNRYLFAGRFFSRGMTILDSCSGLGWGTYIVANYAKKIFAFDINPETISFCKKNWKKKNIKWLLGDALDISFLKNKKFDCVLAMETIEHFSKDNAEKYIANLNCILKKGGFLVGTTPMINIKEKVDEHLRLNPYHIHIFSDNELRLLLQKYFSKVTIIKNWIFIAKS
jgi:ubiquinone/menaquinone biosynthesis C-methylase UbiE